MQSTKRRGQKYEMILTSLHFLSVVFSVEDITQDSLLSREREREGEKEKRKREKKPWTSVMGLLHESDPMESEMLLQH